MTHSLLRIRCDRGQISGVTLVYAAIAVVNTLIMAIRERTRDLAQLRLAGATPSRRCARCHGRPRWSRRWACLLGLAVTGITAVALSEALHQTGSAAPPTLPWTAVGSVVVTTVALALVTSVAAGIAAVRMRPMDGIGIQD